jgi:hypothetical protein
VARRILANGARFAGAQEKEKPPAGGFVIG